MIVHHQISLLIAPDNMRLNFLNLLRDEAHIEGAQKKKSGSVLDSSACNLVAYLSGAKPRPGERATER
jgi:hypothetical protein